MGATQDTKNRQLKNRYYGGSIIKEAPWPSGLGAGFEIWSEIPGTLHHPSGWKFWVLIYVMFKHKMEKSQNQNVQVSIGKLKKKKKNMH